MLKVKLTWEKVLKAEHFDENKDFLNKNGGLYLWIWPSNTPRVIYVGESFRFDQRFIDHFCKHIGGRYLVLNPSLDIDYLGFLKEHFDGKTIEELNDDKEIFCPNLNAKQDKSFTHMFLNEKLLNLRLENLKRLEFAFAALECVEKVDNMEKLRKQVEGALITELMRKYRKITGTKLKLKKAGIFAACVIGQVSKMPETNLEILHEGLIDKIPQEVIEIKKYNI